MEIWKDIKGFEGFYQASNLGRIRSIDRIVYRSLPNGKTRVCKQKGRIISQMINKGTRKGVKPRYELKLSMNGKTKSYQVHRLIAQTFLDNYSEELEVNHIDGNSLNNNVDNLEMVTRLQNIRHAFENGLINTSFPVIKKDPKTKEIIAEYYSVSKAAQSIGVAQSSLRFRLRKGGEVFYKGFIFMYKENL